MMAIALMLLAPFRYLHALEQVVLVFVARICCLEAERTGIDLEHVLDDLGQVRFVNADQLRGIEVAEHRRE
jgi:hypothetical protein